MHGQQNIKYCFFIIYYSRIPARFVLCTSVSTRYDTWSDIRFLGPATLLFLIGRYFSASVDV
jgi:hypothetical protein